MPSRPDLRSIASNVREAFEGMDRETLLDILTFVVKEYVAEGPPPMLVHQAETLADLQGSSFAQLVSAMQTRFDHPELAMFVVDGEQVSVRIGGVVHPLVPGRQPMQEAPRPAAAVTAVEANLQQRPAPAPAPPPTRGISFRERPTSDPSAPPPAAAPPSAPPAAPPAAVPPAAAAADKPEKPEGSGDDASARFSLLELD